MHDLNLAELYLLVVIAGVHRVRHREAPVVRDRLGLRASRGIQGETRASLHQAQADLVVYEEGA